MIFNTKKQDEIEFKDILGNGMKFVKHEVLDMESERCIKVELLIEAERHSLFYSRNNVREMRDILDFMLDNNMCFPKNRTELSKYLKTRRDRFNERRDK